MQLPGNKTVIAQLLFFVFKKGEMGVDAAPRATEKWPVYASRPEATTTPRSHRYRNKCLHVHLAGTPLPLHTHFCLHGPQRDFLLLLCTQVEDIPLKLKESIADIAVCSVFYSSSLGVNLYNF